MVAGGGGLALMAMWAFILCVRQRELVITAPLVFMCVL